MLLYLSEYFATLDLSFLALHSITLRAILAALTALLIGIVLGNPFIRYLKLLQIGQVVRNDGPKTHFSKNGTPAMGGILILFSLLVSILLWGDLSNFYLAIAILTTVLFALIGYWDDYLKLSLKNTKGLSFKAKIFLQSIASLLVLTILYLEMEPNSFELTLFVPIFKNWSFYLGPLYLLLGYFVLVGSSNAVNMTDGLDGLAILPTVMVMGVLGIFAYVSGNNIMANYLHTPYLPNTGELTIFCGAFIGAGLSFLWFNSHPAQVFMGDVGSLALGAAIGIVAFMLRQEFLLIIIGGIFVVEAMSVILQVGCYKMCGKRIFPMAPLHHSFETTGMPETKVVVRFWIIGLLLALIGLATLKIR